MSRRPPVEIPIREAVRREDFDAVRRLLAHYLSEYEAALGDIFARQDFRGELAGLPGSYARPDGALLLADDDGRAAGCVALRRFDRDDCELKRLYVAREFRRRFLGHRLVGAALMAAAELGYRRVVLDSTPEMAHALELYRQMGFVPIAPYGASGHALCFAKDLATASPS